MPLDDTSPSFATPPASLWDHPDAVGFLTDARPLSLCFVPKSEGAKALVGELAAAVEAQEAPSRRRPRGPTERAKLRHAVGAIVGSLLDCWGTRSTARPARRSNGKTGFAGAPVGYRTWKEVVPAMLTLGLLHHHGGIQFERDGWEAGDKVSKGKAARYWPGATLLEAAARHGCGPQGLREGAFRFVAPTKAPLPRPPVIVQALRVGYGPAAAPRIRDDLRNAAEYSRDPLLAAAAADVEAHNELAGRTHVEAALPPRWQRLFLGSPRLYGRWHAYGTEEVYQATPGHRRRSIRIGGQPTVELDVQASHLTILRQLAGLPRWTEGDPYGDLPGVPREAAKAWGLQVIGNGSVARAWSKKASAAAKATDYAAVRDAMIARHPCLADPARYLPVDMQGELDLPAKALMPPYIVALEAEAMTLAMRMLRGQDVLSLPVYDSLIVPAEAEQMARDALLGGFYIACHGARPGVVAKS